MLQILGFKSDNYTPKPIEKLLYEGNSILVQVIRCDWYKRRRLSTQIKFSGSPVVICHRNPIVFLNVFEDNGERELLREKYSKSYLRKRRVVTSSGNG